MVVHQTSLDRLVAVLALLLNCLALGLNMVSHHTLGNGFRAVTAGEREKIANLNMLREKRTEHKLSTARVRTLLQLKLAAGLVSCKLSESCNFLATLGFVEAVKFEPF